VDPDQLPDIRASRDRPRREPEAQELLARDVTVLPIGDARD